MNNKNRQISLTEYGAAEEVAGSKLLLELDEKNKILIDMGMEYRNGEDEEPIPFEIDGIDNLVLTHAHADHIGQTLKLYKAGFNGNIFCTYETADIATKIQLPQQANSVWMQNKRARDLRERGINIPFKKVLWNYKDFREVRDNLFRSFEGPNEKGKVQLGFPYETPLKISENVKATFYEAGHIPGSSQILFEITNDDGRKLKLLTAFDLGRTDYHIKGHSIANTPIVKPPHKDFPKDIDAMVIEATYGDKKHGSLEDSIGILEDAAKYASKKNGKLIIPAFSIMRTHMLEYFLYDLDLEGRLPDNMHFYVSSPGADKCGRIILKHSEDWDEGAIKNFIDKKNNFFYFDRLTHHKKVQLTKDLLAEGDAANPYGIIASSGMCQGGRIERILRETVSDPKNLILLTGYQAPGTRGFLLANKETKIPFYDESIERKAEVQKMGGLSGHADIEELVAHVKNIYDPTKDSKKDFTVFIKHGEKESCHAVKRRLVKENYDGEKVIVMKKGESYNL